jgi:SSS family solute:Na+ symporter
VLTLFILLYLLLTLAIGFWAARLIHNSSDFTLAGRNLPMVLVGVTLFATWFGPELVMGVPAEFVQHGVKALIVDLGGNSISLLVVGFFFARRMYRLRIVTTNDFFRLRFGARIEGMTSVINVLGYFPWIAAQFLALAFLFEALMGIPVVWGILLGAGIVVVYTYVGGMWAVSITDLIQSTLIVAGMLYLLMELMDVSGLTWPALLDRPDGFWSLAPEPGVTNWMNHLSLWMVFGVGSVPVQEVYQRVLSARNEGAAVRGAHLGALLLFVIGALPMLTALVIVSMHPELLAEGDGQRMIPDMVLRYMGTPAQVLFFGALISAILSTSSGAMLAPATVIGENLIRPNVKDLSDAQLLQFTRLGVVAVALISAVMAWFNDSIHGLVVDSATLTLVCTVSPFVIGTFWKRASQGGAWCSIGTGLLVWLVCRALETAIEPWLIGMLAGWAAMWVGSLLLPDSSGEAFRIEQVRRANLNMDD